MLKQRIITALILLPLFLAGVALTDVFGFSLFIGAIVTLAAWEWAQICGLTSQTSRASYAAMTAVVLLACSHLPAILTLSIALIWWIGALAIVLTYPASKAFWTPPMTRAVAGLLILAPAWKALVAIRGGVFVLEPGFDTKWIILYIFLIVWFADIGAYFAGKTFGKNKLAPHVSPGKSWEGAVGGMLAVSVLPFAMNSFLTLTLPQLVVLWMMTLSAAIFSIVGDLIESLGKRFVGLKDSSQILPGHGGIFDRIDSVTAAAPVFLVLAIFSGWMQG
ncbi:phosphatidate cytidylyltransferase [Hahella sp. KA22]|uniref:phosphatidate cytidylyltransferase n=1 Tax=Hahella sp. KA22 TaxID=1628392 RepID=UPI000FDF4872|nr:phosphatidate cytidylyltransferase [Hahella sp. KA22]AZZ90919.1 phosphatidate cytidylyltransferase [Hahella sp. KA22]QAY54289.1 phosphatidate cytidylyltransferase [Hahella sp. KA22]